LEQKRDEQMAADLDPQISEDQGDVFQGKRKERRADIQEWHQNERAGEEKKRERFSIHPTKLGRLLENQWKGEGKGKKEDSGQRKMYVPRERDK